MADLHVVTGAFGYTGRFIAEALLARGHRVRTLTNARADPFGGAVEVRPIDFADPRQLRTSLDGAAALHNTYWVRYDRPPAFGYEAAVANTRTLFAAARDGGVGRVVHISVAGAHAASAWGYFRGKAALEADLAAGSVPHTIVRPTIVFGGEGNVFINNIAWMLRRFPVFGLVGRGSSRVTPIHVRDVATVCADAALAEGEATRDAGGPETMTYREMVATIARGLGLRRPLIPMPAPVILAIGRTLGWALRDTVLTRHEIDGLRSGAMEVPGPPAGSIRLIDSVVAERDTLGRHYRNDLARRLPSSRR